MHPRLSLLLASALAGQTAVGTAAAQQAPAQPAGKGTAPRFEIGVPEGFDALVREQRAVLDIFMGGSRVATAEAIFGPGQFRFADPAALAATLPGIADRAALAAALADPALDPHRELSCSGRAAGAACPALDTKTAGIVFDEARFRVDIHVNPALLETRAAVEQDWLPAPTRGLSLTNALGGSLSGAAGSTARMALIDNAILAAGPARLRADLGWQTGERLWASTLSAELDRRDMRYLAGAFWAPGTEVTGRRKLLGLGMTSQFDTRTDRDQLQGVPLIVHLDQRSRVDVLVAGRLMSSALFDAGKQALDTGALPEGSYEVTLRITAPDGRTRQERRFFTRSTRLPPVGRTAIIAAAGLMVDEGRGSTLVGDVTGTPMFQFGLARRVGSQLALNIGAIGTDGRQLLQLGGSVIRPAFQFDLSLLGSAKGDLGLFARFQSNPAGRLSYNVAAQIAHTRDGRPLLPQSELRTVTLSSQPQFDRMDSIAQVSGDVALQLGQSRLALAASWRRAGGVDQYTAGPNLRIPLVRTAAFDLVATADYALTERGRSGYVGLSLRLNGQSRAVSADSGLRHIKADGRDRIVPTGALRASLTGQAPVLGDVQAGASLARDDLSGYAAADLSARGRMGELSANVAQPLSGGARTQYAATFRIGMGAGQGGIALGRFDGGEAAVVASVAAPASERFDVMVNDVPRASLRGGQKAVIQLPGYRLYDVRLRSAGGSDSAGLGYDGTARRVSLFPGNVAAFRWETRPQVSVFARLVLPGGTPVAGAALSAGAALADTDGEGAFLMQLENERIVTARLPDGHSCRIDLSALGGAKGGFVSAGTLICTPSPVTTKP